MDIIIPLTKTKLKEVEDILKELSVSYIKYELGNGIILVNIINREKLKKWQNSKKDEEVEIERFLTTNYQEEE